MVLAQLVVFRRVLVQRHHAAADRIAGGVVAAHDQEDQVAQEFLGRHVPRRLAVGQHRDQVVARLRIHPLVPQVHEIAGALHQFGAPGLFRLDDPGIEARRGHVRPAGQFAAILPGEVEQGRQHLGGQLDRDPVDPVESLAHRQVVEDLADPASDQALHQGQVVRRDDRADHLALRVMLGRVHRNEHRQREFFVLVEDGDAALGRENPVVGVHVHDVVEAGHRPIGAVLLVHRIVHGVLIAQPLEEGPVSVVAEALRFGRIDLIQRHGVGFFPRVL